MIFAVWTEIHCFDVTEKKGWFFTSQKRNHENDNSKGAGEKENVNDQVDDGKQQTKCVVAMFSSRGLNTSLVFSQKQRF